MPRLNTAGESVRRIVSLTYLRIPSGTIGDTTTTEPVLGTGAETTIDMTAATNFTAADICAFIGTGGVEATVIGTPATTMPVAPPPRIAQATGCRFVELESITPGKIVKDSVSWTGTRPLTSIYEELADAPMLQLSGVADFGINYSVYNYNGLALQHLMGYADDETGDGAAYATAYQAPIGIVDQELEGTLIYRLNMLRHDAQNIQMDFTNAVVSAQINSPVGSATTPVLAVQIKSSAIIFRQWT